MRFSMFLSLEGDALFFKYRGNVYPDNNTGFNFFPFAAVKPVNPSVIWEILPLNKSGQAI